MNKTIIPVADFDSHDCRLPEGGCGTCEARAEFYRMSGRKWKNLQEKWRLVREGTNKPYINPMVISAIMTPNEED